MSSLVPFSATLAMRFRDKGKSDYNSHPTESVLKLTSFSYNT